MTPSVHRDGERGEFSLTGLLVAMTLFIAVLGATLSIFETGLRVQRDTETRADAQDKARTAVDTLTRQLRNLASPTQEQPQAIDRKDPTDLIFQTVDPVSPATANPNVTNVKRVRYCLDGAGILRRQEKRYSNVPLPAPPAATLCPGAGWDTSVVVADHLTNAAGGTTRPLFAYNATAPTDVTSVRVKLFVDIERNRGPKEAEIASGVYLRNQNRKPTAAFTTAKTAGGLILNGSMSADPEGDPLSYCWYDSAAANVTSPPSPCPAGRYVGSGVVFQYAVSTTATTSRTITLVVKDTADLSSTVTATVS